MKSQNIRTPSNLDSLQITSVDRLQTGYKPSPSRSSTKQIRATSEGWKQTYDSDIRSTYLLRIVLRHTHTVNQPTFWCTVLTLTLSTRGALKLFIVSHELWNDKTSYLFSYRRIRNQIGYVSPNIAKQETDCQMESGFLNWECGHVLTQYELRNTEKPASASLCSGLRYSRSHPLEQAYFRCRQYWLCVTWKPALGKVRSHIP
jgi:hypothetical protein